MRKGKNRPTEMSVGPTATSNSCAVADGGSQHHQQHQQEQGPREHRQAPRADVYGKIVAAAMVFVVINTVAIMGLAAVAAKVVLSGYGDSTGGGSNGSVVPMNVPEHRDDRNEMMLQQPVEDRVFDPIRSRRLEGRFVETDTMKGQCSTSADCDYFWGEDNAWCYVKNITDTIQEGECRKFTPQTCTFPEDCGSTCLTTGLCSCDGGRCTVFQPRCFSERALVRVRGRGDVLMRDIKVGDQVLALNNGKNPPEGYYRTVVVTQAHHEGEGPHEFLQIYTTTGTEEEAREPLEITQDHLLFVEGSSAPVPSQDVKVGDYLLSTQGRRVVSRIEAVTRTTAYNIITTDGTALVNDILASGFMTFNKRSHIRFMGYDVVSIHNTIRILGSWYHALCYASRSEMMCAQSYNGTTTHTQQGGVPSIVEQFPVNSKLALDVTDRLDVLAPTLLCMCLMAIMPFLMLVIGISGCIYNYLNTWLSSSFYNRSCLSEKFQRLLTILPSTLHPHIKTKYQ